MFLINRKNEPWGIRRLSFPISCKSLTMAGAPERAKQPQEGRGCDDWKGRGLPGKMTKPLSESYTDKLCRLYASVPLLDNRKQYPVRQQTQSKITCVNTQYLPVLASSSLPYSLSLKAGAIDRGAVVTRSPPRQPVGNLPEPVTLGDSSLQVS